MSLTEIIDTEKTSIKMAARLKKLREEKGLSHEKLSQAIDDECNKSISKNSLMNYEVSATYHHNFKSNIRMSAETLLNLADFYEVSTDYLLGRADIKTPETDIRAICEYTGLSEDAVNSLHSVAQGYSSDNEPISSLIGYNFGLFLALNWHIGMAIASICLSKGEPRMVKRGDPILAYRGLDGLVTRKNMAAFDMYQLQRELEELIQKISKDFKIPDWIKHYYGLDDTTAGGADNGEHQTD